MKRPLLLLLLGSSLFAHSTLAATDTLAAGFAAPPASAKPWVFWFWPDGNMTRLGITADLEAMARVGMGGVLIMEVAHGTPKGPVAFASPEWRDLFQFTLTEAKRLGLKVNMNNDAGWTGSAGPWITPALAMQKLTASEMQISGGRHFEAALPQPETVKGYYRDIAVLAFPTPAGDDVDSSSASPIVSVSGGIGEAGPKPANLLDDNVKTTVVLPRPEPGAAQWVQLQFPEPFTARTVTLELVGNTRFGVHGEIQVSEDGQTFRTLRDFDAQPPSVVLNFPATTSRWFRLNFTKGLHPKLDKITLADLHLSPGFRIENLAAKAAFISTQFTTERNVPSFATWPAVPQELAVAPDRIVDLSSRMEANGKLSWDAPSGNWTILRVGYTPTGKENHPAPEAGTGLESDKLSKAATQAAFAGLIEKLIGDSPALAGGDKTLVATHVDSWEVGSQNWTPLMREDFKRLRGYDPVPFLPVITGRVVGSIESSERFLWDLRQTVSELLQQNYAAELRRLANAQGMRLTTEAYFGCPTSEIAYGGQVDEPMAEFWWTPTKGGHYSAMEMASAAHVYGHPIVGAESFTAGDKERWLCHPANIKDLGDWAFCQGINRFVFHRYSMQPWADVRPGTSMGMWGLHYERTQTWWEQSRAWHQYLSRCQYLLQRGLFVADICYMEPEGITRSAVPASIRPVNSMERPGYNFDACPPEVVLTRMTVKDGRIVLPDGMSYRMLLLPEVETMSPELLRKIKELADAGATIIGPKAPSKSPSLKNYPQCDAEVAALAAELWPTGKVISGKTPAEVLAARSIPTDFSSTGGDRVRFIHRALGDTEFYFVASKSPQTETFLCSFRAAGRRPELWWPDSGRIERIATYDESDGVVRVPIRFEPSGSVFVVFRADQPVETERITSIELDGQPILSTAAATAPAGSAAKAPRTVASATLPPAVAVLRNPRGELQVGALAGGDYRFKFASGRAVELKIPGPAAAREIVEPWTVAFDSKWGGPEKPVSFANLTDWTKRPEEGIRAYSGTAHYHTTFSMGAAEIATGANGRTLLDLGQVAVMAEVRLNGRDLGILWKPPFQVDVTDVLRPGENVLEVAVTNLWVNRQIADEQLPADSKRDATGELTEWPDWLREGKPNPTGRYTFSTWRLWKKDEAFIESGLIGPVRLQHMTITTLRP